MTDKQKQTVRSMRQRGIPYSAIADAVGLSPNTVKSFCRRENVTVMQNSLADEFRDTCAYCEKLLSHSPGRRKKRFCSDKCRSDWWNKNRQWARKRVYHLLCNCCGTEFISYGNKKRKYCGRDCYIQSRYGEGLP